MNDRRTDQQALWSQPSRSAVKGLSVRLDLVLVGLIIVLLLMQLSGVN